MAHPMGESKQGDLRVDFDRRLKPAFHRSKVTTDTERPHTSLNGLKPKEFATRSKQDHNQNRLYLRVGE